MEKKVVFEILWLSLEKRFFSKTYPYFFIIKEGSSKIIPSFFTIKEGSTSLLGLLPSGKKRETALRCSEPLRFMVGGPSKVCAMLCGLGPPGDNGLLDGTGWRSLGIVGEIC